MASKNTLERSNSHSQESVFNIKNTVFNKSLFFPWGKIVVLGVFCFVSNFCFSKIDENLAVLGQVAKGVLVGGRGCIESLKQNPFGMDKMNKIT